MSQVSVKIGPKSYTIACGPGEEERVAKLGALIDEQYSKLGNSRAPLEATNLVFAALFMADELSEARSTITANQAEISETRSQLQRAEDDAANALQKATASTEQEKAKAGGKKAELRAEIDTLRKAEQRARKENDKLRAEISDLKEQARHQHDLFGGPADDAAHSDALAEMLETLAAKAEAAASELEGQLPEP